MKAIGTLKDGQAPGVEWLKAELLTCLVENGIVLLHIIIKEVWTTLTVPKDWRTSVRIPILKESNQTECFNSRGVP